MEKTYHVNGMTCVICKNTVEKGLNKLSGVNVAKVNLLENEVLIDFNEAEIDENILALEVKKLGYELLTNEEKKISKEKYLFIISILLMIILMYLSMGKMFNLVIPNNYKIYQLILSTIIIILNKRFYLSGFRALLSLKPNMDSLVSISSFASYIYSIYSLCINKGHLYFETSAMVLVIVSIGKYIEGENKKKATKALRGLSTLIPMHTKVIKDNKIITTKTEDLKVKDICLIMPGDSIPQDGIVVKGSSTIDESLLTGESLPVNKKEGDLVIGGTVNLNGTIEIMINKHANQTTLSKILSLTKQASMSKIKIERFVDKIANYFVYGVILISIITFLYWIIFFKNFELALNFSLSVLVISCPCALGLATPSAISVAIGNSARNGILIKNPEILEVLHNMKYLVLDKTGTLTNNALKVIEEEVFDEDFYKIIVSLEKNFNHPISKAILNKYEDYSINFKETELIPAKGIIGRLDEDIYYAGNLNLINDYIDLDEKIINKIINKNLSYLLVGKNNKLLGIIYLDDTIKDSSFMAIDNLNKRNINPIMATGDNEIAAKKTADALNIKDYHYGISPLDKSAIILKLKEKGIVGMVGDGINDAIALSSSDISFSLEEGTDIASASSDIILMSNDLNDINFAYDISKKTMKIIKENLFWALFYNAIFIPLAAGALYNKFGFSLNPMIGSFTMSISSIFVLSNALRINKVKKEK